MPIGPRSGSLRKKKSESSLLPNSYTWLLNLIRQCSMRRIQNQSNWCKGDMSLSEPILLGFIWLCDCLVSCIIAAANKYHVCQLSGLGRNFATEGGLQVLWEQSGWQTSRDVVEIYCLISGHSYHSRDYALKQNKQKQAHSLSEKLEISHWPMIMSSVQRLPEKYFLWYTDCGLQCQQCHCYGVKQVNSQILQKYVHVFSSSSLSQYFVPSWTN